MLQLPTFLRFPFHRNGDFHISRNTLGTSLALGWGMDPFILLEHINNTRIPKPFLVDKVSDIDPFSINISSLTGGRSGLSEQLI